MLQVIIRHWSSTMASIMHMFDAFGFKLFPFRSYQCLQHHCCDFISLQCILVLVLESHMGTEAMCEATKVKHVCVCVCCILMPMFTQAQVWLHHKYTKQWKGGAIIFARRPFSFDISVRMANVTLLVAGSGLQVV